MDDSKPKVVTGWELKWTPPDGAAITGLCVYGGYLVVATDRGIWRLDSAYNADAWEPVK